MKKTIEPNDTFAYRLASRLGRELRAVAVWTGPLKTYGKAPFEPEVKPLYLDKRGRLTEQAPA